MRVYATRRFCMPDWCGVFKNAVDGYDDEVDIDVQMGNYIARL